MNCAGFEQWLDDGTPPAEAELARSHALRCPACARAWEAQRSVDSLLDEGLAPAPPLFADTVMARIMAEGKARGTRSIDPEGAELPWWIRLFAEPSTVLALVIASLLVGWGGKLSLVGGLLASEVGRLGMPAWFPLLSRDWLGLHSAAAVWAGVLFLAGVALLSVGLYRGITRAISV